MTIGMSLPNAEDLLRTAGTLSAWQHDNGPLQLHPGDLGWHSMRGAAETAAALRIWSDNGHPLAIGLLDGPELLRLALDPQARDDDDLALQIAGDLAGPEAGVTTVEARGALRLTRVLSEGGWLADEPWTPFHRALATAVEVPGVRIESVGPDHVDLWTAVHWSAFRGTPFDDEDRRRFADRWRTMTEGPFSGEARSLVAFDTNDDAVAIATVWPAGPGRPGLLEPLGVHRDHRGRGYGKAITLAAAMALRELGASSAIVCAETANAGAVASYASAGFTAHEQVTDLRRCT